MTMVGPSPTGVSTVHMAAGIDVYGKLVGDNLGLPYSTQHNMGWSPVPIIKDAIFIS